MLKIMHRVNAPAELAHIPQDQGVEIDVHAYGDRVVVHHDPFVDAPSLEAWLDAYRHAFVILNIKEEGIEQHVLDMVVGRGIENFFMLDLSFPSLIKMVRRGERRIALRVSDYENVASALTLAGKVEWIWLDVFHGFPIGRKDYECLRNAGFRLCLVSPELHDRPVSDILHMQMAMREIGVAVDAVCTKRPELW